MNRIERLINLVAALLDTRFPMTAEQIRERIAGYDQGSTQAFRRTFERDKKDLRDLGIPIETVTTDPFSEHPDAYVIPKARAYLPDLHLEPDEVAALQMAADAVLGSREAATAGFLKLSLDAPSEAWGTPRRPVGADVAAEEPLLGPLMGAQLERRAVSFEYRTSDGDTAVRVVQPYSVLYRHGRWYVLGHDESRNDIRAFRVSRIGSSIEVTDRGYEVPPDFKIDDHLGREAWEGWGADPEQVVIRFGPEMSWWAEHNMRDADSRDGPDGSRDVSVSVSNIDALIAWVIGLGEGVEILSPDPVRRRLVEHLQPLLETS